MLELKAQRRR